MPPALSEKLDEDHHAFEALVVLLVNILIGYECDCVHIASRLKLPIESSPMYKHLFSSTSLELTQVNPLGKGSP